MKIFEWKKGKKNKNGGFLVWVDKEEAISLIHSLSEQIIMDSPNSGRLETFLSDGREFTIAVNNKEEGVR